jgi:hypothetical protein
MAVDSGTQDLSAAGGNQNMHAQVNVLRSRRAMIRATGAQAGCLSAPLPFGPLAAVRWQQGGR